MAKITSDGNVFSGKTATFTSGAVTIDPYSDVTLQFIAASIASGNGVFSVDGSNDGSNWVTGISFQDPTATASTTHVASQTLSSNTNKGAYLKNCGFNKIRVVVTVTTDGSYSCIIGGKWAPRA